FACGQTLIEAGPFVGRTPDAEVVRYRQASEFEAADPVGNCRGVLTTDGDTGDRGGEICFDRTGNGEADYLLLQRCVGVESWTGGGDGEGMCAFDGSSRGVKCERAG